MKIVIPVTSFDFPRFDKFISVLEHWGGLESFEVVVVPSAQVSVECESRLDRLRLFCGNARILNIGYEENANQWPSGPNKHWVATVYALDGEIGDSPGDCWFWMETDCLPVQKGWARSLMDAYGHASAAAKAQGKPNYFLGKIVATPHRDAGGNIIYHPNGYQDHMMMGCAVYPSGMTRNPQFGPAAKGLANEPITHIKGVPPMGPWDVELRAFFKKSGWTDTDLIGDRWNTVNYRIEGDLLLCDAGETKYKNRAHNNTDVSHACVIHGCKDDTLPNLILSGTFGSGMPAIPKQEVVGSSAIIAAISPVTTSAPTATAHTATVDVSLHRELAELKTAMEKGFAEILAKFGTSPHPEPAIPTKPQEAPVVVSEDTPLVDKLRSVVVGNRGYRAAEIASKCKCKVEEVYQTVQNHSEEFKLSGPSKWISRKAA